MDGNGRRERPIGWRRVVRYVILAPLVLVLLIVAAVGLRLAVYRPAWPPDVRDLQVDRPPLPAESNAYTYLALATNISLWACDYDALRESATNPAVRPDVLGHAVTTNAEGLAWIEEALRRDDCQFPVITNVAFLLPEVSATRSAAKLMVLQAQRAHAVNDDDEAFDRLRDIVKLGSYCVNGGGVLIHYFVGVAIQGIGLGTMEEMLASSSLSSAELRQLARDLDAYADSTDSFCDVLRSEYQFSAMLFSGLAEGRYGVGDVMIEIPIPQSRWLPRYLFDPHRTNAELAERFREMIGAVSAGHFDARAFDGRDPKFGENLFVEFLTPNPIGRILIALLLPAVEKSCAARFRHDAYARLVQTLVALKAYSLDRGELPGELEQLLPVYLTAVPVDPFDGKPLRYVPGERVLYSIGMNVQDDGGSTNRNARHRMQRWAAEDMVVAIEW